VWLAYPSVASRCYPLSAESSWLIAVATGWMMGWNDDMRVAVTNNEQKAKRDMIMIS